MPLARPIGAARCTLRHCIGGPTRITGQQEIPSTAVRSFMGNYMQPREILSLLPPPEKLPTQNETHLSTGHPTQRRCYLCVRILQANDQCPLPYRLKTERRTVSVHCGCFRVARRTGLLRLFDQPSGPRCNCCSCNFRRQSRASATFLLKCCRRTPDIFSLGQPAITEFLT